MLTCGGLRRGEASGLPGHPRPEAAHGGDGARPTLLLSHARQQGLVRQSSDRRGQAVGAAPLVLVVVLAVINYEQPALQSLLSGRYSRTITPGLLFAALL